MSTQTPAGTTNIDLVERQLAHARRNGARAMRQLHRRMAAELRQAEQRARKAERRLSRARGRLAEERARADAAERELASIRSSATWRARRAFAAGTTRLRTGIGGRRKAA